jgi:hypothetical protein
LVGGYGVSVVGRPLARHAHHKLPQLRQIGEAGAAGFVRNGAEPGCPSHLSAKGLVSTLKSGLFLALMPIAIHSL